MGHDSMHAAIGDQHATAAADARITASLEKLNAGDDQADEDDGQGDDDDDDGASGAAVPASSEAACGPLWPDRRSDSLRGAGYRRGSGPVTWAGAERAGDGNRTRIVSLGRAEARASRPGPALTRPLDRG